MCKLRGRNIGPKVHGTQVRHLEQRLAGCGKFPGLSVLDQHCAVYRRGYAATPQGLLHLGDLSPVLGSFSLGYRVVLGDISLCGGQLGLQQLDG